jgi:hypothetical protein
MKISFKENFNFSFKNKKIFFNSKKKKNHKIGVLIKCYNFYIFYNLF